MTSQTLISATIGTDSFLKKALLVLGGSALIAIAAQISVPFYPVPMTLQTLAILAIGLSFGARLGMMTVLAYLAEGAAGLPVFANGGAGLAYMAGPSAGFLLGFVAMAGIAGFAARRGLPVMLGAALLAAGCVYIPGLAWPAGIAGLTGIDAGWAGLSFDKIWAGFAANFVLGDALKAVLAALAVSGGWAMIGRKS